MAMFEFLEGGIGFGTGTVDSGSSAGVIVSYTRKPVVPAKAGTQASR
jgi:hypothetical protein